METIDAETTKMIDETWEDFSGRKHRLYTVRSMGPGRGFGIIDRTINAFVWYGFNTREEAWDYLREE